MNNLLKLIFFVTWVFCSLTSCKTTSETISDQGFVHIESIIPNITIDARYYYSNNFIGKRIEGYKSQTAILSKEAAFALKKVQAELNDLGLGLKVFDAYRPQRAVNHFVLWAKDTRDTIQKRAYYPDIKKSNLFKLGYIAERSGHTRGSTVDLTLIKLDTQAELDMGSRFDFFGPISGHNYQELSKEQLQNRILLKRTMEKHGFVSYSEEWWHYTLKNEPYPDQYFNFEVK